MTPDFVPVIDLQIGLGEREHAATSVVDAVTRACETSGFFVITGHGVTDETTCLAYNAFVAFFRGPQRVRSAVAADLADPLLRGWIPGERHEQFYMNRLGELAEEQTANLMSRLRGSNRWPEVPGLRAAVLAYYGAMEELAGRLAKVFALAMGVPPADLNAAFQGHMSPLVCNYYGAQPVAPPEGSLRNAQHRDWCAFTILYQDEAPGGLQVQAGPDAWVDVPHLAGSFVVNLGRIMTLWSGGRWASTVHRVVNPARSEAHRDRISMPFFAHPHSGLPLHPLSALNSDAETAGAFHVRMADSSRERKRLPAQSAAHVSSGVPAEFEVSQR